MNLQSFFGDVSVLQLFKLNKIMPLNFIIDLGKNFL